jgi:hypothetical protein
MSEQYSGLPAEVQAVARVEGPWHASLEPVAPPEVATQSDKTRRGARKRYARETDGQDSSDYDEDGDHRAAVVAARKRKASDKEAQKSKVYNVDDPSTWKVSDLTAYLKDCRVASSGLKKPIIQRAIDHNGGLLRTRVVGEQRSREESGGVIEDGDVGSVGSVDQGRGSQEGDTVGGGGGDVGEDREVLI